MRHVYEKSLNLVNTLAVKFKFEAECDSLMIGCDFVLWFKDLVVDVLKPVYCEIAYEIGNKT